MATLFANYAFDYRDLDLNLLISNQTDFGFYNNIYEPFNGKVYEDVAAFQYYAGGYVNAYFGGHGITLNANQTVVTGGTVTGVLEEIWNGSSWKLAWGIQNFSVSAVALSKAASTSSTADDFSIISSILSGNDIFKMSNFADVIRGYAGNDSITGNGGNDVLYGDSGNDALNGGSGADILIGGAGKDKLFGGSDTSHDVFDFNSIQDSRIGSTLRDVIYNFKSGTDDIDLGSLDANISASGNQAFKFSGGTAKAYSVWSVKADLDADGIKDDLLVRGDVNGNTVFDFEIAVIGATIASGDLFL